MKHTHHIKQFVAFGIVTTLALTGAALSHVSAKTTLGQTTTKHSADSIDRIALRLQRRVANRFQEQPSLGALREAVTYRRAMFKHTVTVAFQDDKNGAEVTTWTVTLGSHPEWMSFDPRSARFTLDRAVIEAAIVSNPPEGLTIPSFATVVETHEEGKIVRATIDGTVSDGQIYDASSVADTVVDAYKHAQDIAVIAVKNIQGAVLYNDGTNTHVLHELGTGRSEFASSPYGRKMNVRKAMNEKANGVVIPQGSTFSFNSTLGGPVTNGNGWYDSLIIVNGRDLEPAPGGGICQGATTVFRAAVAAGLPIVTRKSHSLFVHYYEEFGVGLDATIFPGRQDMTFQNDTQGPIVLLGRTDDTDNAYSTLYGISDDRIVTMDGPYFGHNYKEPVLGHTLRHNEVAWVQRVQNADGTVREDLLLAKYLSVPKSVAAEYQPVVHGAADLVADLVADVL